MQRNQLQDAVMLMGDRKFGGQTTACWLAVKGRAWDASAWLPLASAAADSVHKERRDAA